jgi:hypothetical protein
MVEGGPFDRRRIEVMSMRRLRFRIRIRSLALLIVLVALGFLGWRVYREGPEVHWEILKLRFGNVQTRRNAAHKFQQSLAGAWLSDMFGLAPMPTDPQELKDYLGRRQERGDLLFSALLAAANDPDPESRATALSAAGSLAVLRDIDGRKDQVLAQAFVALRDGEAMVRVAGLGQLAGLARPENALRELKAGLLDPAIEVREAAALQLGMLGVIASETQLEVASILGETLAGREDVKVRLMAAGGFGLFGVDHRRTANGPDVVPDQLTALRDPEVKLRRHAAYVLSRDWSNGRSGRVSSWNSRRDARIPACRVALADVDDEVRDYATLALFLLGVRDPEIIARLEAKGRSMGPNLAQEFREAAEAWRVETEPKVPGE